MSLRKRWMRTGAIIVLVLGALVGVTAWAFLHVEDIPDELEPVGNPDTIVIDGVGSQSQLAVANLRGAQSFFVSVGIQSWQSDEGRSLNRALNRWVLPRKTKGFIIFDAEGLGFLQESAGKYMDTFGKETRFPMYGDFEGVLRSVFALPQGHHGLVVLGPGGEVQLRKVGGAATQAELDEIAALLGATEPAPGPAVPTFSVAGLDASVCEQQPCVLLFLDRPVARTDIPGIEGGFEGEDEAAWKQVEVPAFRMISSSLKLNLEGKAKGIVLGEVNDLELPGWTVTEPDDAAATALDAKPGETTMVILKDGRVVFHAAGFIPMYRLGEVSDHLGVEYDFKE